MSHPASPGDPSQGPGGVPEPRTHPKKRALMVGAGILALVLVVVGALAFRDYRARVAEERALAERAAELSRQEAAATDSARGYLEALAASEADGALSFAAAPPEGNNDLLTRDVLLEANKRAAIGGVTIDGVALAEESPGVWNTGTAQTRYTIGDQPQTVDLPLRKVGDAWKLDRVAAPVKLGLNGPDRLVNGVTAPPGMYNLFPGSYSVTSTNPLIGLTATEFTLASPVDDTTDWEPAPTLSDEGRAQSIEAAKRAVDACLQRKELAPPECPWIRWRESNGVVIDKSTIQYTLVGDPWANVDFRFYGGTMTAATTVDITHRIDAQATQNGVRGTLQASERTLPAYITVDLAQGQPQVSFS